MAHKDPRRWHLQEGHLPAIKSASLNAWHFCSTHIHSNRGVKEYLYLPFKKVHTHAVLQIDSLLLLFAFCRKCRQGTTSITGQFSQGQKQSSRTRHGTSIGDATSTGWKQKIGYIWRITWRERSNYPGDTTNQVGQGLFFDEGVVIVVGNQVFVSVRLETLGLSGKRTSSAAEQAIEQSPGRFASIKVEKWFRMGVICRQWPGRTS